MHIISVFYIVLNLALYIPPPSPLLNALRTPANFHPLSILSLTPCSIYRSDPVNYFVLESQRTLPTFLEISPQKHQPVQKQMFQLLEHVMVDLNYVPIPELTSLGLLLQQRE